MTRNAIQHCCSLVASLAILAVTIGPVRADGLDGFVVQDPHYGEVLFHFYQQDQFTALTHLVTARSQNRVQRHQDDAELLQGGLLLSWGQHDEAGKIFERLLDATDDTSVRNRTWFYLAKVRYQRGHLEAAERAFESITAPLPPELEAERYNLQARLYMDNGRYAEAVALLNNWHGDETWTAYANYNTGVALVRMGQLEMGATLLDRVGTMRASTEEMRSLRDQANVALGFSYLQAQLDGDARSVLLRVRLNGPFSNKALLGAGWADSAGKNYQAALGPWLELSDRDLLDSAVQESLLAVPYAFAQLGAEPQAAEHYTRALDIFGTELARLDNALADADTGRLLNSLLETEPGSMGGWYWQLDSLPDDERTRYLYFAIADHRFHEGLKSYRDLAALDTHLTQWRDKLGAYRDMLATRELAYAERLPVLQD
jgi:tetratricopeptide (TPR) repeat protein